MPAKIVPKLHSTTNSLHCQQDGIATSGQEKWGRIVASPPSAT
jgi:hypothetical protein